MKTLLSIFTRCALAWLIMFTCSNAFAHFVLPLNVNAVSNDTLGLLPGDTLFIAAGERQFLTLQNFQGSEEQPIHVLNRNGLVHIHSSTTIYYQQGLNIKNCEYLNIHGNGDPEITHGFEISQTLIGSGIDIRELSGGLEIAYVQIHHTHFAGIIAKDDPDCTGRYLREAFLMKPLYFHHNYIHHTTGEGMYIGSTAYEGMVAVCKGEQVVLKPHLIEKVELAFNRFESTGREAIQVFSSQGEVKVHHNRISEYALNQEPSHSNGVTLGLGTHGDASYNRISNGYGHGVALTGSSWTLQNNLIVGAGGLAKSDGGILACGVYVDEAHLGLDEIVTIGNNTIVRSRHNGLRLVSNKQANKDGSIKLVLFNNLFADFGSGTTIYSEKDTMALYLWKPLRAKMMSNLSFKKMEQAGFADLESGSFELSEQSKALDMGVNVEGSPVQTDLAGSERRVGHHIDIGAYEYPLERSRNESGYLGSCKQVFYPGLPTLSGKDITHEAGDTFCLAKGDWSLLQIRDFEGGRGKPVVFTNYDGQVQFKETHVGLQLKDLKHVNFSRINTDTRPWYLRDIKGDAVVVENCEDVHVSHFSMSEIRNFGVRISTLKKGNGANEPNKTKDFELSYSHFSGIHGWWSVYVLGTSTQPLQGIDIHHNTFSGNAGGAIRCGFVDDEVQVWKNEFDPHGSRLMFLDSCRSLNLYANRVYKAEHSILELTALETAYIHNNVLEAATNCTIGMIELQEVGSALPDFQLANNTVILTEGPLLTENNDEKHKVFNNLIVLKGSHKAPFSNEVYGVNLMLDEGWDKEFLDFENGDFQLQSTSKASCIGSDIPLDFMRIDFNLVRRVGRINAGAYVFTGDVHGLDGIDNVSIYPNPINQVLQVLLEAEPFEPVFFSVYSQSGKLISGGQLNSCLNQIEIGIVPSGQYLLKVSQGQTSKTLQFSVLQN